ncbi:hypothetical protein COO60DRAFT_1647214 [Scenedesmus sp. NREL 46B-D3]|nr:hypothetical protein COO60DRAFT_1647214 [Scenedesmus sp. NREL 46B-D3]
MSARAPADPLSSKQQMHTSSTQRVVNARQQQTWRWWGLRLHDIEFVASFLQLMGATIFWVPCIFGASRAYPAEGVSNQRTWDGVYCPLVSMGTNCAVAAGVRSSRGTLDCLPLRVLARGACMPCIVKPGRQVEDEREAAAAEDRPQDAQVAAPVMPAIKDPGLKAVAEMAQQNIWTDSSQGEGALSSWDADPTRLVAAVADARASNAAIITGCGILDGRHPPAYDVQKVAMWQEMDAIVQENMGLSDGVLAKRALTVGYNRAT